MTALEPKPIRVQKHLHLLGARVLRLVEDYEAPVQRPASHECERGHLDRPALEQALCPFGTEQVVEGVVKRPEIRVDLRHDVAG